MMLSFPFPKPMYNQILIIKPMRIKQLVLLPFLVMTLSAFAQQDEKRIELDLRDGYEDERAYPLSNDGFLIQSFGTDPKKGQIDCKNDFYSTGFKLLKSVSVPVKERTQFVTSYDENGINYTMIRNRRDYFAIITADAGNLECKKTEGLMPDLGLLSDMVVHDDKAIFKVVDKKASGILIIDLKTGKIKFTPVKIERFAAKDLTILDFQVFDDDLLVFTNAQTDKSNEDLYIVTYNMSGQQKDFFNVTKTVKEKLITASATKIGNKYIITGTFSKTRSDQSQGIFIGELENKKLNFIRFYNFLELKNFTGYLTQKQQDRIERKKDNKEKQGKEMLLNYRIVTHPIIESADGYTFLGEAFYPTYNTYTTSIPNGNGGSTTQVHTVFDGYQYTHATLAKFDFEGNLLWDNTFSMWSLYKPFRIKKLISFSQGQENAELAFSERNTVKYKVFNQKNGDIIKDNSKEIIETYTDGDKVKRSFTNIDYWYDNNFIAFGIQTISNKEVKRKRRVFFVNNIVLNND